MADPTPQERRILEELRDNPFLSQMDLAKRLRISRSTVASHVRSLQTKGHIEGRAYVLVTPQDAVLCVGGINTDITFRLATSFIAGTSNIGSATDSPGGVARNVAEAIASTGTNVILVGPIGDDNRGRDVIRATSAAGVDCTAVTTHAGAPTGTYTAVIDPTGGLVVGLSDMRILDSITWEGLRVGLHLVRQASWMFIDANLPQQVAEAAIGATRTAGVPIAADAVSIQKASRFAGLRFDLVFCNVDEAAVLLGRKKISTDNAARALVELGHGAAVVTHGPEGASWANTQGSGHCPAINTVHGDVTGAGDALIAGTLVGLNRGENLGGAVTLGTKLASLALGRAGASSAALQARTPAHSDTSSKKENP